MWSGLPIVRIDTGLGSLVCAIDDHRAPIAATNFLAHVDGGHLAGTGIYRVVTLANQERSDHQIEVAQWGFPFASGGGPLPPIAHETTGMTGIRHVRGSLSMARREPGTAGGSFFFCVGGDLSSLDEGGGRQPDGQGFTAFGQIIAGWTTLDLVMARAHATQERLPSPIPIKQIIRLQRSQ